MAKEVYFWGDLHIGHQNAYKFPSKDGDRKMRPFASMEECELLMVENYNKIVKDDDIVYFLGDIILDKKRTEVLSFMKKGAKHLILGNHDNKGDVSFYRQYFDKVYGVLYLPKLKSILTHVPVHSSMLGPQSYLNGEERFKYNIHGHCVSLNTEILTKSGWKKHDELIIGEEVYSLNNDQTLSLNKVKNIHKVFSKEYFEINSRGLCMNITPKHKVVRLKSNNLYYEEAEYALQKSTIKLPRSGFFNTLGINLSDELLRLYICLAADGTIKKETKLCRFIVHKKRKILYFENCLKNLRIEYKKYKHSNGDISLNFYLPEELNNWNIKGLDVKLFKCSRSQCFIILDAYKNTDGNRNLIFTSKKTEVEILEHLLIINGFCVKTFSRKNHGFSEKTSYQLSITDRQVTTLTNPKRFIKQISDLEQMYWCPEISNIPNFIAKYKGSIFITGNCHDNHITLPNSNIKDMKYLNTCVEVVNYKPVTFDELISINKLC